MVGVALLAAFGWPVTKVGLDHFEPFMFMGIRFFLVGLCLAPWALRGFEWRSFGTSCVTGITMIFSTVLWVLAVDGANELGLAGFIIAVGMILSPLYSHLFFGERVNGHYWIRLGIAVVGGALLAPDFKIDNFLLFAAAAFCFGWQMTLINRQVKSANTLTVSFGQMLTIGAGMLVLSLIFEDPSALAQVEAEGWFWVLGIATGLTGLRFVLQIKGQRHLNHQETSFLLNLESVFVLLVTAVWFGEGHSMIALIGGALVFWAAVWRRSPSRPLAA